MQKYDGKSSFLLYDDWAVQLNKLTLEQRGILITNVFAYKQGNALMPMDAVTDMLFSMIRAQLDRDATRWEEKKERRRAAGAAGGRASGAARKTASSENGNSDAEGAKQSLKNEANVTFASNLKQTLKNEANEAVTVNVPVPVTVPVTVPVPVPVPATVTVSTAGAVDNSAPAAADGESALRDPAVAKVMSEYMEKIDPSPSPICVEELIGFARELGPDVCTHAMYVAMDAKAKTWLYIRKILNGYRADGVRCLADIQTREEKRGKNRAREPDKRNAGFQQHGGPLSEAAQKAVRRALEEAGDG